MMLYGYTQQQQEWLKANATLLRADGGGLDQIYNKPW